MRRSTVMGFTEAELGFVLAAVFAGLAVAGLGARQVQTNAVVRADSLQGRYDSLSVAFDRFRDSVRKKSNKTPRCSEKGESAAAIAELRVLGRDRYGLGEKQLSLADVEANFAPQIKRSEELGCHYLVRVVAVAGVDSPAFAAAVNRLWANFDVGSR